MDNKSSMDEAFLQKLRGIVEDNLGNAQFGVENLAHEAGMSRSQIHRKLSDLSGKSTTQFIREIRLEHAREMLADNVGTVSEIAYRVGFNSPTYFSTCFHEYFGHPPGETSEHVSQEESQDETGNADATASKHSLINSYVFYSFITLISILLIAGYYYWQTGSDQNTTPDHSIAVLPLDNLTGDPEQSYYVDGLHDALIGELGQLSGLRVISRTSTLRYRDTQSNIRDIANQLDVDNIIEGSVYRTGDSVRVQVQLIDVRPEEKHIWAESYERDTRNILNMLSEVTREVARNVDISLSPVEDSLLTDRRQVDPEAYRNYLRGQHHLNSFTEESYNKGISYLLEATQIDPGNPLPWARLALGYTTAGHGGAPPPDAFRKAQAAADRALKLDDTLGEVHLSQALIDLYRDWDWETVDQKFEKILTYDPNIAEARLHFGWYLILEGATLESVEHEMRLAMKLDPFNPLYAVHLAFVYWYGGETEQAIEMAHEALELNKDFALAHYLLGLIHAKQGNYEASVDAFEGASALNPNWSYGLVLAEAMAGDKELAREKAQAIAKDPSPLETWGLAEIYTALGETDKAFKWLEASYEARWSWIPWVYWNPPFDPLIDDPRFDAILKRLELPNNSSMASVLR